MIILRPNTTKRALSAGKMVVGTMVFETRVPGIASLLAAGGFDFFIVDGEHSPTSLETIQAIALAARGANITCLAR
ncbi:MAG: aldolase, partial [Atribacterota bacterium]